MICIWQLFRLFKSILDAVLSLFVDAGISPCSYIYPCWEQWLAHQVKYTPPSLAHFQHCSQWGLIRGLQGVPMTEQSLAALYGNCFSACSRAEQEWKILLSPSKISNQSHTATINQNDRWVHLLQGTVQTRAIPSPQSQHSEDFTRQSHCPLSQMAGPALHKAINSCVLAG